MFNNKKEKTMKKKELMIELTLSEKESLFGGCSHVIMPEPGTCPCNPIREPGDIWFPIWIVWPPHIH